MENWVDRSSHEGSNGAKVLERAQLFPFSLDTLGDLVGIGQIQKLLIMCYVLPCSRVGDMVD